MKENETKVIYKDKVYNMVFNLNVVNTIQKKYGSISEWTNLTDSKTEPNIEAVLFGVREMLNEGIEINNEDKGLNEPLLSEKTVGRIVTEMGIEAMSEKMQETVIGSSGVSEEKN